MSDEPRPVWLPVASRTCARPGCAAPAEATLAFRYGEREVSIGPLSAEMAPHTYDLCGDHADRTRPPSGWELRDARSELGAPLGVQDEPVGAAPALLEASDW